MNRVTHCEFVATDQRLRGLRVWRCAHCRNYQLAERPGVARCRRQAARGLGDSVARLTAAAGLPACGGCRRRQQWLNALVPYAGPYQPQAAAGRLRRTVAIIAACGRHELTRSVAGQCRGEGVDVLVVDGQGDYRPRGGERVLRTGENLGWLRANNLALRTLMAESRTRPDGYERFVLLNNDLRLSRGFFAGLVEAEQASGASIVAASYDGHWQVQNPGHRGAAEDYQPVGLHLPHGACDGTCVSVHRRVVEQVGLLDEAHFGRYGWWAMTDWCIRAKMAGLTVAVTRAAFANHLGQQTGRAIHGVAYQAQAQAEATRGRAHKWGRQWSDLQSALVLVPLVVYTAITGQRDRLAPPQVVPPGVRWVAFVDRQSRKLVGDAGAWELVDIDRALEQAAARVEKQAWGGGSSAAVARSRLFDSFGSSGDPRRRYKPVKCLPQVFGADLPGPGAGAATLNAQAAHSMWLDASFDVRGDVRDLAWYLGAHDLAMFDRWADRGVDCVYEEARRCTQAGLDDPAVISAQMDRYRAEGHPEHWGLGWTGCLVRRHTEAMAELGLAWLGEIERGSKRDQLSQMVCLRRLGLGWSWIPGSVRDNAWLVQRADRPQRPGLDDAAPPAPSAAASSTTER